MFCQGNISLYKLCLERIDQIHRFIKEKFPVIYSVFFDRENKWRFSRYTLSYFYGIFIAFIFWEFILCDLGFSMDVLYGSLIAFLIILGLGYTFSKQIRCITLLTCLGFWGKSGRSFLRAMIYVLIISGPIKNIADNGRETIRVFSCSAVLTYNLTKTRFDLMTRPFVNAIVGMKENITTIKKTFENVDTVVEPIIHEIEDPDENNITDIDQIFKRHSNEPVKSPDFYQEKYTTKIEQRCELQLKKGEMKCKKAFAQAYEKCYEKLPTLINTLFCWPMKITVVCNLKLYTLGNKICDAKRVIDERLGENYYNLVETKNKIMANLSSVKLNYQVISPKEIPGVQGIDETRKEITEKFAKNKTVFDRCMKILKRILAFIFVKVIFHSISYHRKYVKNIDADNIYITGYFKRIDQRRKESGKRSLLPLKKAESREIIDPASYRQSKSEGKGMVVHILKLLLELITALIFLFIDHIIFVLLDIVRDNARIEYYQDGEHILDIKVNGTGIIANLIRATLKGFNTKETIHVKLSNEQCLPQPSHLSFLFYFKFSLLYMGLTFLICNQRIIYRMRHVICSYFYRKQEKRRVLHLYNKLLKRRKQIFVTMQEVVREEIEKHRIQQRLNLFVLLRMKYPVIFGWLKMFPIGRRFCLICREPEPRKYDRSRPSNFANCKNPKCYFTFCEECWFEAGEECLACKLKKEKSSPPISEDDF